MNYGYLVSGVRGNVAFSNLWVESKADIAELAAEGVKWNFIEELYFEEDLKHIRYRERPANAAELEWYRR